MSVRFSCQHFHDLDLQALYQIMVLRQQVFIVEQNCPYLDADGKDEHAWHLSGVDASGALVAYARLVPEGISYPEYASIGRVVTSPLVRRTGVGRLLMQQAIDRCCVLFGNLPIKISAQEYLTEFYESFGFRSVGTGYLEDDIPHIAMVYTTA